jgi:serine/threonine-protein kinase HipA
MRIGNTLEVIYKGETRAGKLIADAEGYHFEYDDDFLADPNTLPISVNLPKTRKVYHSTDLFPYFKSMLSEGENREQICKAFSIDPSDDWSLLALSCQYDTIGAITVKIPDHGAM